MTSQHRHGRTGTLAIAGDIDAAIAALDARIPAGALPTDPA